VPGGLVAVIISIYTGFISIYTGLRHPLWPYWWFAVTLTRAAITAEFSVILLETRPRTSFTTSVRATSRHSLRRCHAQFPE
jgi:hypothetical protein